MKKSKNTKAKPLPEIPQLTAQQWNERVTLLRRTLEFVAANDKEGSEANPKLARLAIDEDDSILFWMLKEEKQG